MRTKRITVQVEGRTMRVELPEGSAPFVDGQQLAAEVCATEPGVWSVLWTTGDGRVRSFRCIAERRGEETSVLVDGQRAAYRVVDERSLRSVAGSVAEDGPRPIKAPMPGRVVRVLVQEGQAVEAGQGCVVIEAMKMQNELKAARTGRVTHLRAVVGETVSVGEQLLVVE